MAYEVVTFGFGQCGVQNMTTLWDVLCQEHGIGLDGAAIGLHENQSFDTFFTETSKSEFVPRCIMVDFEPSTIDAIFTGQMKNLFNKHMSPHFGESACTYTRGQEITQWNLTQLQDTLRRVSEETQNLAGMVKIAATAGGTGSALSVFALDLAKQLNPKKARLALDVTPFQAMSQVGCVGYYNALAAMVNQKPSAHIMNNNVALRSVAASAGVKSPCFQDLNYLIAGIFSHYTSALRFHSRQEFDFQQILTNLIPFPRTNIMCASLSQVLAKGDCSTVGGLNLVQIMKRVWVEPKASCTLSVSQKDAVSLGVGLQFRGNVKLPEIHSALAAIIQAKPKILPDFGPFKTHQFKLGTSQNDFKFTPRSKYNCTGGLPTMCSLNNTFAITQVFTELADKVTLLTRKGSFCHWFNKQGEDWRIKAKEQLAELKAGYQDVYDPKVLEEVKDFEN